MVVASPLVEVNPALLQYFDGTWKSPVNSPVARPVSTRVNPVSPRPSSIAVATAVVPHVTVPPMV